MSLPRILVGEIGRPHGVRGLVRVQSFTTEPSDIAGYGPLLDESGAKVFELQWLSGGLAKIDGITDRDAAAKLTGTRLFVERDRLPEPDEEEFYLADLIGLTARDTAGAVLGQVRAVEDFGAGSFITVVLAASGKDVMVPFTRAAVPEVELAERYLVVVPPEDGALPEGFQAEDVNAGGAMEGDLSPSQPRRQDVERRGHPRPPRGGVTG
jgi:16S rRNA processing protein RimM